jgi:hypothetical protein
MVEAGAVARLAQRGRNPFRVRQNSATTGDSRDDRRTKAALERLRAAGGLTDVIPAPAAWQHEIRTDVVLPVRE